MQFANPSNLKWSFSQIEVSSEFFGLKRALYSFLFEKLRKRRWPLAVALKEDSSELVRAHAFWALMKLDQSSRRSKYKEWATRDPSETVRNELNL